MDGDVNDLIRLIDWFVMDLLYLGFFMVYQVHEKEEGKDPGSL